MYKEQIQIQKKSLKQSKRKQETEKENSENKKRDHEVIVRVDKEKLQIKESKRVGECKEKYEVSSCEKSESCLQELSSLSKEKEGKTTKEEIDSVYAKQRECDISFYSLSSVVPPLLQEKCNAQIKMGHPIVILDPREWVCINSSNQRKNKLQPYRDGISNDNSFEHNLVDSRTNPFEERGNDTILQRTSWWIMHPWRAPNAKLGDKIQISTPLDLHRIVVFDPGGFRPIFMRTPTPNKPNLIKAQLNWVKHIFSLLIHVIRAFDLALIFRLGYLDQPLNPLFLALKVAFKIAKLLLYNATQPLL